MAARARVRLAADHTIGSAGARLPTDTHLAACRCRKAGQHYRDAARLAGEAMERA